MEERQGNSAQQQQDYERGILQVNHSGKTPDRTKRDEWSEGGVATLLDAYESKWVLRNKAKLKGNDWEEIAGHVCARNGGSRPWKTQSQCKNKIEALKKRYRSEATAGGTAGTSTWTFFERMDVLLRCPAFTSGLGTTMQQHHHFAQEMMIPQVETGDSEQVLMKIVNPSRSGGDVLPLVPSGHAGGTENNRLCLHQRQPRQRRHHHHHNQHQLLNSNSQRHQQQPFAASSPEEDGEEEDASNTLPQTQFLRKRKELSPDSDTSTPKSKIAHAMDVSGKTGVAAAAAAATGAAVGAKRRKDSSPGTEVADSIRMFADSILKLEQAKMQMFKNSERLRAETEARHVEMELKRTEIIAKTQLEIAKLLAGKPFRRSKLAHNNANSIPHERNNKNKNKNKNSSNSASQPPSSMNGTTLGARFVDA